MGMVIGTNVASLTAQRHLESSRAELEQSMERLSSGKRINSAMDDAAGLAIRDRMTSQVNGLNQAVRNAGDAISLGQTAEGALEESTSILQRMRELSVQSVNGTNSADDRKALNSEVKELQAELTRIATSSQFNGKTLLDGSFTSQNFQIGQLGGDTVSLGINNMSAETLGLTTKPVTEALGTGTYTVSTKGTDTAVFNMTVGSQTVAVTHTAASAATTDASATAIKAAWDADATALAAYTVAVSGSKLTFTETAGNGTATALTVSGAGVAVDTTAGTGAALSTGTVGVTEALGTATFTVSTGATADDILTLGVGSESLAITFSATATAGETATAIKAAWDADDTSVAAYTVAVSGAELTFTQTAGNGSATAVAITSSNAASDTVAGTNADGVTAGTPAVTEVLGTGTFTATAAGTSGKTFDMVVGEQTVTVTHDATSAATTDASAAKIKAAWDADATAVAAYTVAVVNSVLTFTETAGNGTASALSISSVTAAPTPTTAGTGAAGTTGTIGVAAVGSSVKGVDITTATGATAAITVIDSAIKEVGQERAKLGAFQNRLEHTVSNLQSMVENTGAAQSRIEDADFATESANLAKNQVLQQAGTAMLSQANASTQNVLSLLK